MRVVSWNVAGRVRSVPETTVTYLVNPESYFTRWDGPAAPATHAEEVPR